MPVNIHASTSFVARASRSYQDCGDTCDFQAVRVLCRINQSTGVDYSTIHKHATRLQSQTKLVPKIYVSLCKKGFSYIKATFKCFYVIRQSILQQEINITHFPDLEEYVENNDFYFCHTYIASSSFTRVSTVE